MATDFHAQIAQSLNDNSASPEAAAHAIVNLGRDIYKHGVDGNPGTGPTMFAEFKKALQSYLDTDLKDKPANTTVAILAAQSVLDKNSHFHENQVMSSASTAYAQKYDHRTADQVRDSLYASLHGADFDAKTKEAAGKEFGQIDATQLKIIDQHLLELRNSNLSNGNVQQNAKHYAEAIVKITSRMDYAEAKHFMNGLKALGSQPVNPLDPARSAVAKGMLAAASKFNSSDPDFSVSAAVSAVSKKDGGVNWDINATRTSGNSATQIPTPPTPSASGSAPAAAPAAPAPTDTAGDAAHGVVHFDKGSATINAGDAAALQAFFVKELKARKDRGALKRDTPTVVAIEGDADGSGKVGYDNAGLADRRAKAEARIFELAETQVGLNAAERAGIQVKATHNVAADKNVNAALRKAQAAFTT